jgi:hypothetical protein
MEEKIGYVVDNSRNLGRAVVDRNACSRWRRIYPPAVGGCSCSFGNKSAVRP